MNSVKFKSKRLQLKLRAMSHLLLIATSLSSYALGAPLQKTLLSEPTEKPIPAEALSTLQSSIEDLSSDPSMIQSFASQKAQATLEISTIRKSSIRTQNWQTDPELRTKLSNLIDAYNFSLLKTEERLPPGKNPPLNAALLHLVRKYGLLQKRLSDRDGYLSAINSVLKLTRTGKSIDHCFKNATDDKVSDDLMIWFDQARDDLHLNPNLKAAFFLLENPSNPGHFSKTTLLSIFANPLELLLDYGHERKHGCHAVSASNLTIRYKGRRGTPEFLSESDRSRALDELRAYRSEVDLFVELSSASPELFSRSLISAGALSDWRLSNFDRYFSNIQTKIKTDEWPVYLLSRMTAAGLFHEENIFKVKPGSSLVAGTDKPRELDPQLLEMAKHLDY